MDEPYYAILFTKNIVTPILSKSGFRNFITDLLYIKHAEDKTERFYLHFALFWLRIVNNVIVSAVALREGGEPFLREEISIFIFHIYGLTLVYDLPYGAVHLWVS